jgi:exosortase/archaeosortase family protein
MDPYNPIIAAHRAAADAPRGRWAARIDAAPPGLWLALQLLALWPALWWSARRVVDGSDDPLGLVALALLGLAAVAGKLPCGRVARPAWLAAALAATVLATALVGALPPLAHAVLAGTALACAWAAFRAQKTPVLPVLGLLWLALPLLASLQFYAGFPLRAVTAWLSAGLLQGAGVAAQAAGASVMVDGRLVLVDAPCSGVQLAWFAYCAASAAALWRGLPDGRFLRRLPWVGVIALLGNVVRNTLLVASEGGVLAWPAWSHDAVGLLVLCAVCAIVAASMREEAGHARQ